MPDDGGNVQRSGQAQIAGSIVAFDGDDGDAEFAEFEAQPETDLSQSDDDDVIAAGENPLTDQADEAGSEQTFDYPGGEHGGEHDRRQHRQSREHVIGVVAV